MAAHMAATFARTLTLQKTCCSCVSGTLPLLAGYLQVRNFPSTKHYDPKFRKQRARKFLKVDIPDFQKLMKESRMSPDEFRMKLKKDGKLPPRTFQERPINISNTGTIFEPFIPPEGDGRSSIVSKEGMKQKYTELEKKGKSLLELRKVRKFEDGFDTKEFAQQALDIVVEAQQLLTDLKKNQERLHDLVTEKAFPEMVHGLDTKTVRWQFVQSLESPRVVHVRTTEMLSKDNLYAQVTVRLHTQQILAIYDRFGRLMYGDPEKPRDVLEYVVLEKHIANEYGQWRVHGKIIPDWMPPRGVLHKTYVKPEFEPLPDLEEEEEGEGEKGVTEGGRSEDTGLATA
ncbi:large ribosomal subunit protein mL45-like [Babylonia areolata]|uniref:large ribosomal subunit protein mL45-like n=1 Tax=Babylonia areolata TaxID=304850 RepID=UPI003FD0B9D1